MAAVVADEEELVGELRNRDAVAGEPLVLGDGDAARAQRGDEVGVVTREPELVARADVHVDPLRREVRGRSAGDACQRILGQVVRAVGIVVEDAVALAEVAGAGHAVETDVGKRLPELGLEDQITVQVVERLRVVHDDPIADVVDTVAVQVGELTIADVDAGRARRDRLQRAAREQQHVDGHGRRFARLAEAVLVLVTAVEESAWVRRRREDAELVVAPDARRLGIRREVLPRRIGIMEVRIAERDHEILEERQARIAIGVRRQVIEREVVADVPWNVGLRLHLEPVVDAVAEELLHVDGAAERADDAEDVGVLRAEVHRAVGAHRDAGDRAELP